MAFLLDTNCLIALLDRQHVHHGVVRDWFDDHAAAGWATCPLTENGFVRIVSQPRYPGSAQFTMAILVDFLRRATAHPAHCFWEDRVTLRDELRIDAGGIAGPGQITDCYLLALAVERGGRLVTLDAGVSTRAVMGSREEDVIVLPTE